MEQEREQDHLTSSACAAVVDTAPSCNLRMQANALSEWQAYGRLLQTVIQHNVTAVLLNQAIDGYGRETDNGVAIGPSLMRMRAPSRNAA